MAWQSLIIAFKNRTGKWAGLAGRRLASQIYRYKQNKSQRHLGSELEVLSTIAQSCYFTTVQDLFIFGERDLKGATLKKICTSVILKVNGTMLYDYVSIIFFRYTLLVDELNLKQIAHDDDDDLVRRSCNLTQTENDI